VSSSPSASASQLDRVGPLMREVAQKVIVPRFCALAAGEVEEKAPGELVTIADREAEELLTEALMKLLPGSRVVGEERCASEPQLLTGLDRGTVWLIDPLDGTSNFIAGHACFATMIALLREGEPCAAFILDPMTNVLTRAELGAGAYLEGERLYTVAGDTQLSALRGAVLKRYMPETLQRALAPRLERIGEVLPGTHCAGAEYPAIVQGRQHFAMFWRTLPWDHAPGTLLVREAGGVARRYDGTPYRPADSQTGLLVAANEAVWEQARRALLED
jgi:fructose-1,6-bisphosphatase/inositol monophosphatase family enzyme